MEATLWSMEEDMKRDLRRNGMPEVLINGAVEEIKRDLRRNPRWLDELYA